MERVPTGIEEFDKLIEGGIPRGFSVALLGVPGTYKSLFSRIFASEGLIRGEPVIYVTYDRSPDMVRDALKEILVAKGRSPSLVDKLHLVDCWSWRVKRAAEEEGISNPVDFQNVYRRLREIASSEKNGRIVLDSLTGVISVSHGETQREISEVFKVLKAMLRLNGYTQLYILYSNVYKRMLGPLLYCMDGIFRFRRSSCRSKTPHLMSYKHL
ncbi:MAG: RAD55 family ATPase, partial [Candidatus Methanodesulfokora sp.]